MKPKFYPVIARKNAAGDIYYPFDSDYPSVYGWSFHQLDSSKYQCCRIRRATGGETDIGFVNGYCDTASIESFCSGTTGYITTMYNQGSLGFTSSRNLAQATAGNQPIIYESGALVTYGGILGWKGVSPAQLHLSSLISMSATTYMHCCMTVGTESVYRNMYYSFDPKWSDGCNFSFTNASIQLALGAGVLTVGSLTVTGKTAFTGKFGTGGTAYIRQNGSEVGTGTTNVGVIPDQPDVGPFVDSGWHEFIIRTDADNNNALALEADRMSRVLGI